MTTIRQQVAQSARRHVREALVKSHQLNYSMLYVDHDGSLHWGEEVDQASHLIDRESEHFAPVESLLQVGTGSCRCNCDPCWRGEDPEDYGYEGDEYSAIEEIMTKGLGEISVGYFEDEMVRLVLVEEGVEQDAEGMLRLLLEDSDAPMGWREAGYKSAMDTARAIVGACGDDRVIARVIELVAEKLHE